MGLLMFKKILGICLLLSVGATVWGMQNQVNVPEDVPVPQEMREMLLRHKGLTEHNKKIAQIVRVPSYMSFSLASFYSFFKVLPRIKYLDSKFLAGRLAQSVAREGLPQLVIFLGFSCGCIAIFETFKIFLKKCVINNFPGRREKRALEDTIAHRADQMSAEQVSAVFNYRRRLGCHDIDRLYRLLIPRMPPRGVPYYDDLSLENCQNS